MPSVSAASAETPGRPSSARASASAYSWLRPPRPWALRTVTESSPPLMMATLRPAALASRASAACVRATSRASPVTRIAQIDHLVALALGQRSRGGERGGGGGDDAVLGAGEGRIAGLGRLVGRIGERCLDGRRQRQAQRLHGRPAPVEHGARVGERGGVGNGRAGADGGRVVARHVGDGERQHGRSSGLAQAAALDARDVAAHRVHLVDVGAALEEPARQPGLGGEREAGGGRGPQRGGAARQQHQDEIALRRAWPRAPASAPPPGRSPRPASGAAPRRSR